jgi:uncharacterized protein (TIGR03435 family)
VARTSVAILGIISAIILLVSGFALRMHVPASSAWKEFSIGPASGRYANIEPSSIRADGIALKTALSVAHDIPVVRIIGPPWIAQTRYSLTAVVDDVESFRRLLQQELKSSLHVMSHIERRPFDVAVLSAPGALQLARAAASQLPRIWVHNSNAHLEGASMDRLAVALQSILERSVINKTDVQGTYVLDFAWGENRMASVTAAIHDRFGLQLSTEKRDLDALIIDSAEPDLALSFLAQVGRLSEGARAAVRRGISKVLSIH